MKKLAKSLIYFTITVLTLTLVFLLVDFALEKREERLVRDLQEVVPPGPGQEDSSVSTVLGEMVCLPVIESEEPHNDLCVYGLKTYAGDYYRLKSAEDGENILATLELGQDVQVKGLYTIESDDLYQSLGTIVVSSVQLVQTDDEYLSLLSSEKPTGLESEYSSYSNYGLASFAVKNYNSNIFKVNNGEIDCEESELSESNLGLRVSKKNIAEKKYCIAASSEGAAGSVYTEYNYATVVDDNLYFTSFIARDLDCNNYPEEEKLECQRERESNNLDKIVDQEVNKYIK